MRCIVFSVEGQTALTPVMHPGSPEGLGTKV